MAAALFASHQVIQPDLLGFGQSVRPAGFEEVWVEAQAAALAAQSDAHGVERFVLVGHDGGPLLRKAVAQWLETQRRADAAKQD